AIRIAGAGQKCAKTPALQGHLLAAIFAILNLVLGVFGNLFRKVLDEVTVRITRTTQEESMPADALEQLTLPALFAFLASRNSLFVGNHFIAGLVQVHDDLFPEFFH